MKPQRVDLLNIGLLFLSLVLAYVIPFRLFLFAYAVLGPLHYLTEINWIRDKKYFVSQSSFWPWVVLVLALGVVVPKFFYNEMLLADLMRYEGLKAVVETVNYWSNAYIFLALVIAVTVILVKSTLWRSIIIGLGVLVAIWINSAPFYVIMIGLLLPTLIHVYLFTVLFMLYGAMRSDSRTGYWAVGIALACAVFIFLVPVQELWFVLDTETMQVYEENRFYMMHVKIGEFFGLSDGKSFNFAGPLELKIQVFIAFAYLYHYLNWFSKTTVIGWHKRLTTRRSVLIAGLWMLMVLAFWYDYRLGYVLALFLSFMHVMLEFPLNVITVRAIGERMQGKAM